MRKKNKVTIYVLLFVLLLYLPIASAHDYIISNTKVRVLLTPSPDTRATHHKIYDKNLSTEQERTVKLTSTVSYKEDFGVYSIGNSPLGWLDTQASNSMEPGNLFSVFEIDGEKVFGTASALLNIHSHFLPADLPFGFQYTGKMRISAAGGGVGITFLSDYPNSDNYYRLRTSNGSTFHIAPHLQNVVTVKGNYQTEVTPRANVWYNFKIRVQVFDDKTHILAKVWEETKKEPVNWQVDCYDDNANRLTDGIFGVWAGHTGSKYWKNLKVTEYLYTEGADIDQFNSYMFDENYFEADTEYILWATALDDFGQESEKSNTILIYKEDIEQEIKLLPPSNFRLEFTE